LRITLAALVVLNHLRKLRRIKLTSQNGEGNGVSPEGDTGKSVSR
jgi:hypothetical protein